MKTSPKLIKKFYTDLDKKIPLLYNLYIDGHNNKQLKLKDVHELKVVQQHANKPVALRTSEPSKNDQSLISWATSYQMWDFIDPKTSVYYVAKIDFKKILTIDTIKKLHLCTFKMPTFRL